MGPPFHARIAPAMARYTFVCMAFSPRDGGWVRTIGSFGTENEAWEAFIMFWDFMVASADFTTLTVKKTIRFR